MDRLLPRYALIGFVCIIAWGRAAAQDPGAEAPLAEDEAESVEMPSQVDVSPTVEDSAIAQRLERIYRATGWFNDIAVRTDEGVVFVDGVADTAEHQAWAEALAQKTQGVVAVVNQISIRKQSLLDMTAARRNLEEIGRDGLVLLPQLLVGMLVLLITIGLMRVAALLTELFAATRIHSQLLRQVLRSIVIAAVLVVGLYVALKVSGLSRLAVTVLGGTGLLGLAIGFAFRDIAENYLASILISLNYPFRVGDLVELEGHKGFVRRVTTRGTVLATLDGNHVQIPNNTVYKSVITNFSVSPRLRRSFTVGIGYEDSIAKAQSTILEAIRSHPATLADPTPMILVDSLGAATVNINCNYWVDAERFDVLAVSSAVMRRAKQALVEAGVSLPDEAREVIFPQGVPVRMDRAEPVAIGEQEAKAEDSVDVLPRGRAAVDEAAVDLPRHPEDSTEATEAEADLRGNDRQVQQGMDERPETHQTNLIS